MEKLEYRAVIKLLQLKHKTPTEIKAKLDSINGHAAPSFITKNTWTADFKRGRTSIFDEERSGQLKTLTKDEMIDYVHEIVINGRRLTLKQIVEAAGILYERAHNILHEE